MKRFVFTFSRTLLPIDDESLLDYSNYSTESFWSVPNYYIRRQTNGYTFKIFSNNGKEEDRVVSSDRNLFGKDESKLKIFNKYSAIFRGKQIPSILESTDKNTFVTNDGIVVIKLSDTKILLIDLLINDSKASSYDNVNQNDETAIKAHLEAYNFPDTSRSFIGHPDPVNGNNGNLVFYPEIKFRDNSGIHFATNCIYNTSGNITTDDYGFFVLNAASLNPYTSITLPPKQEFRIEGLSSAATPSMAGYTLINPSPGDSTGNRILRLNSNTNPPSSAVLTIASSSKEYFKVV